MARIGAGGDGKGENGGPGRLRRNPVPMRFIGVQDRFGESGQPDELFERFGLTDDHIAYAAHQAMGMKGRK